MDLQIIIASIFYLVLFLSGLSKGYGYNGISDSLRHRFIKIAFVWHTLMIILPVSQVGNYFFVVEPYERIVASWAVVLVYLIWTRRYNFLLMENFVLCVAFAMLFPLVFVAKVSPGIISPLWLEGGGVIKHIFLSAAIAMAMNLLIIDIINPNREDRKNIDLAYKIVLGLWIFATGFRYFWFNNLRAIETSIVIGAGGLWYILVIFFLTVNIYYRSQLETKGPKVGPNPMNILQLFILASVFAVVFGM